MVSGAGVCKLREFALNWKEFGETPRELRELGGTWGKLARNLGEFGGTRRNLNSPGNLRDLEGIG